MTLASRVPLRFKVLVAPALVLLALGAVLVLLFQGLERQRTFLTSVHETALEQTSSVNDLILLSERLQSDLFQTAVLSYMKRPREEIHPLFDRLESRIHALNVMYGDMERGWAMSEAEARVLRRMRQSLARFQDQAGQAAEVMVERPSLGMLFVRSAMDRYHLFQEDLEGFLRLQEAKIIRTVELARLSAGQIKSGGYGIALIAFAICIGLSLWIGARWIAGPVVSLSSVMNRLARDDLSCTVPGIDRGDEIGDMARAVEVFRQSALEKRRVDEALKESERTLSTLMGNLPGMAYRCRNVPRWPTEFVSEGCLLVTGYRPEQLIDDAGIEYGDLIHPDDRERVWKTIQEALERGEPFEVEYRLCTRSGDEAWVWEKGIGLEDAQGEGLVLEGFVQDVTARRQADEALRRTEARLRLAMAAADEGLWEWNLVTDEAAFDDVALRMVGYDASDNRGPLKRGSWWMAQVHPEDQEEMERAFQAYITGAASHYAVEYRLRCRDGGYVWVASTGQAIARDSSGRPEVVAGIHRDVSDRKRWEEAQLRHRETLEEEVEQRTRALREAQERLLIKEKLAALGQILGGLGHELRNPLGAIRNAAYFLRMIGTGKDSEARDSLDILDREVSEAERILQSLFDYAAPKDPRIGFDVDLNALIQGTLSRSRVPDGVEVATRLDDRLPSVRGDVDQLEQVIRNLIQNAVQAMPQGGSLLVSTEPSPPGSVEVRVTDTGAGIPEENVRRVFEPLFTTKTRGIGLGLALSRGHVERHGGRMGVESEEGRGTTFTIQLPVSGPETGVPGKAL